MQKHTAKTISRRLYAIAAVLLAAIIFVALNIAANTSLTNELLDLTQNKLYTLSKGTRKTLANLKEPITLKFYYSKTTAADYAQIRAYASRVRDLLQEYAALADGKIILQEIDPEPYTTAEDQATADGLTGAPTDNGDMVYFGLVGTNTIDGRQVIPFFGRDREPYLEYDLTSLIYHLATPKKPVVGILSSLPLSTGAGGMAALMQGRARPFAAYQQLSQNYKTQMISADFTSIPKDVDVLMIVQPGPLKPAQRYAIDQFVLHGGRALVFVDPDSDLAKQSGGMGRQPKTATSSDLPKLFKAWGIQFNPAKVIGDRALAQPVQVSNDPRNPIASYPIWLHLGQAQFDARDQVTTSLKSLNLATAGALAHTKGAATHFTPLVTSSKDAALLDTTLVQASQRPQDLMSVIRPTGKAYVIAARISGPARTAFPDGPPMGDKTDAKEIKSAKAINVIVMADSDIFDDRFWVRRQNVYGRTVDTPFADNGAFILNAVENLTGSNALISLRTRATGNRPFTVVKELRAEAQARFQQEANALQAKLQDTESRLKALEQGGSVNGQPSNATALTPAQKREINKFKRDLVDTRMQLRQVQHNLRKEVDALGSFLAFINIALVPILVAAFALILAILRRRRRARALPL
jgi:ABC-type uncharacterized transport system involved in gliding motility auxiliary subunit